MTVHFVLMTLLALSAKEGTAAAAPAGALRTDQFELNVEHAANASMSLRVPGWEGFGLSGLSPSMSIDGVAAGPAHTETELSPDGANISYYFKAQAALHFRFRSAKTGALRLEATFENRSGRALVLNSVELLAASPDKGNVQFGAAPEAVRVFEQGNYWGRVTQLAGARKEEDGKTLTEPAGAAPGAVHSSDFVSLVYDRAAKRAFLAGFESSERWLGKFTIESAGQRCSWRAGFDAGALAVRKDETLSFEPLLFMTGADAWGLLETYAERVAERHPVELPKEPPVSWCSWYPYRLGVTEERILETARIASERLKPLGLSVIEIDLGWQAQQLPSTFEENPQFPKGLGWLSKELDEMGLQLGVWTAPYSISEFDPIAQAHPEWLVPDEQGAPLAHSEWFWKPHGRVFILDLTHPGAQEHLRTKMQSLHARGIRYLKSDFIGCVFDPRAAKRHDRRVVGGGGLEAARIGAKIIREALPGALLLNCGGPEMPGTGHWPLLYTCSDTGNSGFISTAFQQENYEAVACHLFKNRRWGILQPSCLCVGLPGSIEDARLRATAAFLSGGQIDISDTLTTLPEDRWDILTATLPPLGLTAKPVDLFEPVLGPAEYGYSSSCADGAKAKPVLKEYPPGSVWSVHVKSDWDEWDLVGVFCYENSLSQKEPRVSRYQIPFEMLGLSPDSRYCAYEFWSRQCLGAVPGKRTNPEGYEHPGDIQDLSVGDAPGVLDIAFFGPSAKLLCLRKDRAHPWVAGTSFHQSCGIELKHVAWDDAANVLSGDLIRPRGEAGMIFFTDAARAIASCRVDGEQVRAARASSGAWRLPVNVRSDGPCRWAVQFAGPATGLTERGGPGS